jgi:Condensation domain
VLALSVGQEALWTIYRLAPASAAYNDAEAVVFRPAPDVTALRRALRDLAVRHDLLRSRFREEAGVPAREVCSPDLVELEVTELPGGGGDPRPDLRAAAIALAARPLAITEQGPLRAVLVRRGADAMLVLACHHIASDATSSWLLWRDLLEFYRARRAGEPPDLPPLRSTYADFVADERELLGSPRGPELAAYWQAECAGARPAEIPADAPRPDTPGFRGATVGQRLEDGLARRVRAAATARGITPFALILGAFQALLSRHTGTGDFLVGCPATLRRRLASRDLVGLLVNTVPLRFSAWPAATFGEVSMAAASRLGAARPRARYPFAAMNGGPDGRGPGGRPPALRIGITMVANPGHPLLDAAAAGAWAQHAGHQITALQLPRLEGQTDLTVEISPAAGSLTAAFRYDVDLFTAATARQLLARFARFIEITAQDPSAVVARTPLTAGADEIGRLLAFGKG